MRVWPDSGTGAPMVGQLHVLPNLPMPTPNHVLHWAIAGAGLAAGALLTGVALAAFSLAARWREAHR